MTDLKYNKEEACRRIDHYLTELMKNTEVDAWHDVLDHLGHAIARENRLFIAPNLGSEHMKKIASFFTKDSK